MIQTSAVTDSPRAGVAGAVGAVAAHSEGSRGKGSAMTPHKHGTCRRIDCHSYQGMWRAALSATARPARCMRFGPSSAITEVTAMSNRHHRVAVALAALLAVAAPLAARAEPIKNVVLVHGAWVDGSGWR